MLYLAFVLCTLLGAAIGLAAYVPYARRRMLDLDWEYTFTTNCLEYMRNKNDQLQNDKNNLVQAVELLNDELSLYTPKDI